MPIFRESYESATEHSPLQALLLREQIIGKLPGLKPFKAVI